MKRLRAAICLLAALAVASPALADVSGPDDSPEQAYGPLEPGKTVSGHFTRPDDVDYLSFEVTEPRTPVHFSVRNTLSSCSSPDGPAGCGVWGTLIDRNRQQLGGEGSSAGTGEVDAGRSDVIDWVVQEPGTYYLVMDSGGSLPSYTVKLSPPEPAIARLSVTSIRRGRAARAAVAVRRAVRSVKADVRLASGRIVGRASVGARSPGSLTIVVPLTAAGRKALASAPRHRLRVRVRLRALPVSGDAAVLQRSLTLRG